jgi:tRNA modification GTPase
MANEVIAAIATPSGRGGIGVVRVSGPRLKSLLWALVNTDIAPRRATRAEFRNADGSVIDQGLVLYFPAPHSYTGEDVIELQGHGGPVVLQMVLKRCLELGARVAEPGEFTQRAYLNDKLDLAQAESVADLINASTAEAARCAMRSLQGDFSRRIEAMVKALIELRTLIEAALDFPEEEVEFLERAQVRSRLEGVCERLSQVIAGARRGSLLREGIHVVLAGAPNVGKSSLMNRFAGSERAIVTAIPGTTRDTIHETIAIQGVPLHIIDTAGLRDPRDEVEKIGISKTWDAILQADVVVWISDVTRPETHRADPSLATRLPPGVPQLEAFNKIDLLETARPGRAADCAIRISCKTGVGIEQLQLAILDAAGWGSSEGNFIARARHLSALHTAQQYLEQAKVNEGALELLAEELKLAQHALVSVTGEFTSDDLLGKIFSQFCIGK